MTLLKRIWIKYGLHYEKEVWIKCDSSPKVGLASNILFGMQYLFCLNYINSRPLLNCNIIFSTTKYVNIPCAGDNYILILRTSK